MNNKIIGIIALVVVVAAVGVAMNRGGDNQADAPDVDDSGGFFEGGSMAGDPAANCEAACDAAANKIKELKDARAKSMFESAGCSEGTGGEWFGTMAGGYEYTCPDQASAEALGEAVGNMKDNPGAEDREISDLQDQFDENCPCNNNPPPVPGGMVQIGPPYLIICLDGTSLSGTSKIDADGNVVTDASGNTIDADTGLPVSCI